jgi:tRNA (guanine-N7-)-methyltransferase
MDSIRSYVIRATRMSDHQKEAYRRLSAAFRVPVEEPLPETLLRWEDVFPHRRNEPSRPLILDIGFGMGHALAVLADRCRDHDYLGVEVYVPGIGKLLSEIERRGLTNVRIIQFDAVPVCRYLIPPGTVNGIHLFFPDPWPKKRHHKRRLIRTGFPELVAPLLAEEGYLYLVTDWEDYAHQMISVLDASPALRNRYPAGGFAPAQTWRPETAFEQKGVRKGHRTYELVYDKV